MTALLGYNDSVCGIFLAADRRLTMNGTDLGSDECDKFILAGKWAVLVTGSGATIDVLRDYAARLAAADTVCSLSNEIRSLLLESGWQPKTEDGARGWFDSGFLVSDGTQLWKIFTHLGRLEIKPGHLARAGSGGDYALGAATKSLPPWRPLPEDFWPRRTVILQALREAIQVAVSYDTCSGGEPDVRHWPPP